MDLYYRNESAGDKISWEQVIKRCCGLSCAAKLEIATAYDV